MTTKHLSGTIERDGFVLGYTQEGKGIPAIVIGSCRYYPRTFSDNLRHHMQLIFLDQRAFGRRMDPSEEAENAFALDSILDDIEALRIKLQLEKIVIMGHSIHAWMALAYAKKYPNAVSHTILIAASPFAGPKLYEAADQYFYESVCPERKAALAQSLTTLESELSANPAQAFITRMLRFGPMIWYDYKYNADWLWEDITLDPTGAAFVWGSMFENLEIEPLNSPIFLALGRYDYWNPPHLWEEFRFLFEGLTIRVFEKSSHTPQLEESENFGRELLNWLTNS
jgi:proline iminopeptidase